MPAVSAVDSNLCLFRSVPKWWNDFIYGSRHGCAWLFGNSRTI